MLNGIYPVLCTPFNEGEDFDEVSLRRLVEYVLRARVSGVVVGGIASEISKLSGEERYQIIRITIEQIAGRVPVIVGTSHESTRIAIRLAQEAQALGAAAIMVMPPIVTRPSLAAIAEYYLEIGRSSGIPIMIQDAPMISGISMPVPFILELIMKDPMLSMIKVEAPPTGYKISAILTGASKSIGVFGGLGGNNIIEELERGAVGSLPGSAFPKVLADIYNSHRAGCLDEARRIYDRYSPLLQYTSQSIDWSYHCYKNILWRQGVILTPTVRRPTVVFDSVAARTLENIIESVSLDKIHSAE